MPNETFTFNYPFDFTTLPDYSAHRGQTVEITRPLILGVEYDEEVETMYEIKASDGWIGHAFESELERINDNA